MGVLTQEDAAFDPAAFEADWHGREPADSMCRKFAMNLDQLYRMRRRLGLDPRERVPFEDPSSVEELR